VEVQLFLFAYPFCLRIDISGYISPSLLPYIQKGSVPQFFFEKIAEFEEILKASSRTKSQSFKHASCAARNVGHIPLGGVGSGSVHSHIFCFQRCAGISLSKASGFTMVQPSLQSIFKLRQS
jgi:hypothetical protein